MAGNLGNPIQMSTDYVLRVQYWNNLTQQQYEYFKTLMD